MTNEQLKARRLASEWERLQIGVDVSKLDQHRARSVELDRFVRDHADEIIKLLRTYPERWSDCELWSLTFNSYSAGTSYGAKHPLATDDELANECSRYADAIVEHECPPPSKETA